jgi:oxygen-dependent protoporphyrinogen oxidase
MQSRRTPSAVYSSARMEKMRAQRARKRPARGSRSMAQTGTGRGVSAPPSAGTPSVAVVGAGIAGLTAAYRLHKLAIDAQRPLDIHVLEAADRVGGTIETVRAAGFTMERGPDSIVTEKPWALELCRELGIADDIRPTRREPRGSFIVSRGRLLPIPDGLHLMAPARIGPFVTSPILSWAGKLRALLDLVIPRRRAESDESLASFVRRRLGQEALDRLAQPMVGGVYTADPEKLSLAATMPRFVELERKYGSVIRGLISARRKAGASARGPRYDLFVSHREGLEAIPRTLLARLPDGTVRTGVRVERVERVSAGWALSTCEGDLHVDAVCLATPAYVTAALIADCDATLARELDAIEYTSSTTVNLVYPRDAVPHPLNGFGFVVPAVERRNLMACTFSSVKYEDRAPHDKVLLRAFLGGALAPDKFALDDAATLAAVKADLAELLGVTREPEQALISRYPRSMPQYHVGHLARVDRIEHRLRSHHGLALAGSAYRGTGIPDCVNSGNKAAERLFGLIQDQAREPRP